MVFVDSVACSIQIDAEYGQSLFGGGGPLGPPLVFASGRCAEDSFSVLQMRPRTMADRCSNRGHGQVSDARLGSARIHTGKLPVPRSWEMTKTDCHPGSQTPDHECKWRWVGQDSS